MSRLKRLTREIHQRSVWQVLLVYVGGAWVAFEVMWTFTEALGLPTWFPRVGLILLIVLLPVVLATAFVQKGVGERVARRTILLAAVIYVASALVGFYLVVGLTRQFELPDWLPGLAAVLLILLLPAVLWTAFVNEEAVVESGEVGPSIAHSEASGLRGVLTWRNVFVGALVLFALLGVGVTGYIGMRLLGIGSLGTLIAKGVLEERDTIVLVDFDNLTPDTLLGVKVTDWFRTELAQSQAVRVAERNYLRAALKRMERDPNQPLTYDLAREVAIREGLKAIVAGKVGSLGQGYVLSVRLIEPGMGEELLAHGETAKDKDALIPAITQLSKWLRERVGESLIAVRSSPPLREIRTASAEALGLYTEAWFEATQDNNPRALRLLDRAIEIDTAFAMAYRARAAARLGLEGETAQRIADFTRAFELRHRLAPVERSTVEGMYHSHVTGDYDRAVNAFVSALELNPEDLGALQGLGLLYFTRLEFALAEERFARSIELDSLAGIYWVNLVQAQFNQGKIKQAEQTIRQFERNLPNQRWIPWLRAYMASALGDYSAVEALVRNFLAASPGYDRVRRHFDDLQASLALVHGRFGEAERHVRDAMVGYEQAEQSPAPFCREVWLGRSYLVVNDVDRAVEVVDSVLPLYPLSDLEPLDRPYMNAARFYAQAGRLERSKELLAEYEAAVAPSLRHVSEPEHHLTLGEVALAEGRPLDAVAEFRAYDQRPVPVDGCWGAWGVCTICALNRLGRAYEMAGEADSAIAVYERYVATPLIWRLLYSDGFWLAFTYERLADLYEQRGDTAKAIYYYGKLVELWKDADPELQPRVEAARRAIEALSPDT